MKKHTSRLASIDHRLILVAMTIGSLFNALAGAGPNTPVGLLAALVALYIVVGIFGWEFSQRREQKQYIYGYFLLQGLILISLSAIEMAASHKITSIAAPLVPLLFQSAVLKKHERFLVAGFVYLGQLIGSLTYLSVSDLFLPAVFYAVMIISVLYFGRIIEREEEAHAVLDEANRKLTEYASQAEELAAAKERNRLAREIHDNLGHYLTAVNMQIEAAMALMESDGDRAKQSLERAQSLTKEGLAEVRRAVAAMRAAPIEARPLHEAIQMLVEEQQATGITTYYQIEGSIRPCSAQTELALYRIAQEGLTNIRKHAQASRADLILDYCKPNAIQIRLQDDGIGSNNTDSGFGLLGVRERVKLLGGNLEIKTTPGQGFVLQVELPG